MISTSKEEAKAAHDEMLKQATPMTIIVYTDGSGIKGKVGAATYNPAMNRAT